jgi:hypothetical protein
MVTLRCRGVGRQSEEIKELDANEHASTILCEYVDNFTSRYLWSAGGRGGVCPHCKRVRSQNGRDCRVGLLSRLSFHRDGLFFAFFHLQTGV